MNIEDANFRFEIEDGQVYFMGSPLGAIKPELTFIASPRRRSWYADYTEEQKPPHKELETELGFTRISWFEDGRFKVKRVPIVHG